MCNNKLLALATPSPAVDTQVQYSVINDVMEQCTEYCQTNQA